MIPPPPAAKSGAPGAMTMQAFGKMKRDGGWQPEGKRPRSAERLSEDKLKELLDAKKAVVRLATPPERSRIFDITPTMPATGARLTEHPRAAPPTTQTKSTAGEDAYRIAISIEAKRAVEKRKAMEALLFFQQGKTTNDTPPHAALGIAGGRPQESRFLTRAEMGILSSVPQTAPLIVREYAPPRPGATEKAYEHLDSDTVLWEPVIVLPSDGKTTLTFDIGHAKGGYEVIVAGHTLDGWIGAVRRFIPVAESRATGSPGAVPATGAGGQPAIPAPSPPKAQPKPDKR